MKKIKIGILEYDLMETIFDIDDERFVVFKQHLLQVFESIDKPVFEACFNKCKGFYNNNQHSDVIIELHNFKKAIELKELNYDAYSFCFSLICLEKGELQKDFSKSFQLEKLERMRSQGLKRGFIEETVENFIKASPKTFAVYLGMLELMRPEQMAELLKG